MRMIEVKPRRRAVLFAGGGSGGHVSPALAIAERIVEIDPGARCVFACSGRAVDRAMLAEAGAAFETIPSAPFSARPGGMLRFARDFVRGRRVAEAVIRRHEAGRVVALGGFVAAPVVAAASAAGIPVTLVNLDDPPGKANRWMARHCREVLSAIELSRGQSFPYRVVGMPIRRRALAPGPARVCRQRLGLHPDTPTLLVTGASQGSRSINAFVTALLAADRAALDGWQVCHLGGPADARWVRAAYAATGIRAAVLPFLEEMGLAWGAADLAVSRAGASSVAEAWANAVPTLFLPYPHHRDRHQHRNARPMVRAGGAAVERDRVTPEANVRVAGVVLRSLLRHEARRGVMRANLLARRPPDAARTIAGLLLEREGRAKTADVAA